MQSFKNKKCIIVDLETLGVRSSSIILDMAAIIIDFNKPLESYSDIIKELREQSFYCKFNTLEQYKLGRTTDKDTLDWWERQNDEAKKILKYKETDINIKNLPYLLEEYAKKHNCNLRDMFWLSRGYADINWLDDLCWNTLKIQPFNKFWNSRDVRSIIHAYADIERGKFEIKNGIIDTSSLIPHNSIDDVIYDILRLYTLIE